MTIRLSQIYTKWKNLKKSNGMDVGQVGFNHPERVCIAQRAAICSSFAHFVIQVRTYVVKEKDRDILKALNKTKQERFPDLQGVSSTQGLSYLMS